MTKNTKCVDIKIEITYRQGAAAMREAVLNACRSEYDEKNTEHDEGVYKCVSAILKLPLPERQP